MPPADLSNESPLSGLTGANVVIVAGKGGVGKTTVTAVVARAAADRGLRTLVIELDGKDVLDRLLPDVTVVHIAAADALERYFLEHGFRRIARRLAATGVIELLGTAAPGLDDLVILGEVKRLERSGDYDLVVVDGPAAGHAITMLTSATGLLDAARGGPIRDQARDVVEMLTDPARCQVVMVTLPETTPVNELIETTWAIEERVGVQLGPIVVNQVDQVDPLPDAATTEGLVADHPEADALMAAAEFRRSRREMQEVELRRIRGEFPLPDVELPMRPVAALAVTDVAALADVLAHCPRRPAPSTTRPSATSVDR